MLSNRALANSRLNSLAKAAFDLVALPGRNVGVKQDVDFFECLGAGFGVCEEDVEGHGEAEDAENDVGSPLDVGESRSDEICDTKVEDPVCGSR